MYESKPRWWVLYCIIPAMVGGMFLANQIGWNPTLKEAASLAIIVGAFGGMALWMNANEGIIERSERLEAKRASLRARPELSAMRSRAFPTPNPDPLEEQLPRTGFGSARNKPQVTYSTQKLTSDSIRLLREKVEPSREY